MTRARPIKKADAHGYDFGGPIGVSILTIILPPLCYLFAFVCNETSGCPAPSLLHPRSLTLDKLKQDVQWPGLAGLFNTQATLAVLAYYAFSLVLWALLPAATVQGTVLQTGGRITYRLNAFSSAIVTLAICAAGTLARGSSFVVWTFAWHNYVPMLSANILVSFALATFMYVRSFSVRPGGKTDNRELAAGAHTGNLPYDWFMGRELNPPVHIPFVGTLDIKSWMELRPGMLGWLLLNFSFMARQYHYFGKVTDSMIIVCVSQSVYVLDALYMESAILTTIDITTDGFGFMLAFGDLVWVPFTYSLHSHYLAVHPVELGWLGCLGVLGVLGVGYSIFRSTNNQKNRFRNNPQDPAVAHLKYITTKTGSRLLVSGWWGRARHINYLGDWIMSWAYCLPTGIAGYVIKTSSPFRFKAPVDGAIIRDDLSLSGGKQVIPGEARGWGMLITYFFMVYFAVLLVHRERRDEEKCRRKYGKDWEEYCKRVPSRIIPGIY